MLSMTEKSLVNDTRGKRLESTRIIQSRGACLNGCARLVFTVSQHFLFYTFHPFTPSPARLTRLFLHIFYIILFTFNSRSPEPIQIISLVSKEKENSTEKPNVYYSRGSSNPFKIDHTRWVPSDGPYFCRRQLFIHRPFSSRLRERYCPLTTFV